MKNRHAIVGYVALMIGIGFLALAPLEMYCFYLFSEGGRFHYEGFRFGSFMFGNISGQIVVYFFIGIVFVIAGYGHIRLYAWARRLTVALSYSWLIVGAPIILLVVFILLASKDLPLFASCAVIFLLALSYLLFPLLIIRHYSTERTVSAFKAGSRISMIDDLPVRLIINAIMCAFLCIVFFLLIFFNCIFPLMGVFRTGREGIFLIEANCLVLSALLIGTLQKRRWAWWILVFYDSFLMATLVVTFSRSDYHTLLAALAFPAAEMEMLEHIPLKNHHLIMLFSLPAALALANGVLSRKHYSR